VGLIPREVQFFDLLEAQARTVMRGARMLRECLEAPGSLEALAAASKRIHDVEHEGDDLVHHFMARLNKSFITPLDREDLHALCSRLDDVLDYVDAVAKRMVTFRIERPTDHAVALARIIDRGAEEVFDAVRLLRSLDRHEDIVRQCARINQLENDADQVMRDALNSLFNGEAVDPIDVIRWKDLYEHLEIATDKCEDVANIIESVLVKYT
jgi:predicted phosphate transport protein (TIGR00153 family)